MADGTSQTITPEQLAALEARVTFLEQWLHIPAVHLPGYVAPQVAEKTGEPEQFPVA